MKIREDLIVNSEQHPYADSLKEKLMTEAFDIESSGFENAKFTNIVGTKLTVDNSLNAPSKIIGNWVTNIMRNAYFNADVQKMSYRSTLWFAKYNKDDYTRPHSHRPSYKSFVYFVKSPKGSSPLVFTNTRKKIQPVEGIVVVFDGGIKHHVPPNKCEDRVVLAGNIVTYYNTLTKDVYRLV